MSPDSDQTDDGTVDPDETEAADSAHNGDGPDRLDDDDSFDDNGSDASLLRAVAAAPPRALESHGGALLATGTLVDGTFRIESRLGRGAMGVVYVATDTALDRRVALKLHASRDDDATTSRMWREARAMARLSHPNVITVHEVGVYRDRVYIAMELVDGSTLRDWLDSPRRWQEVRDIYLQAAQGLAAAHHVGVVHRDFKPSNVLLGRDGRVRVADFGLARAAEQTEATLSSLGTPSPTPSSSQTDGAGTPAYMAPEQFERRGVDHRSDQFSFCVSLYEALHGERPFDGLHGLVSGRVREPTKDRHVPQWLRSIVLRGLQHDPDARFPDMNALIEALRRDPTRARRIALTVGAVAIVGLGVWGKSTLDHRAAERECGEQAAAIETVWGEGRRRLATALAEANVVFADETLAHSDPLVEPYVGRWRDAYATACHADLMGELPSAQWAATRRCLEERKTELDVRLEVLATDTDEASAREVLQALATLRPVAPCSDPAWLARHPADAPELPAEYLRARALRNAGRYEASETLARQLEVDADDVRGQASIRILLGGLANDRGRPEEAANVLGEAFHLALGVGDDELALEAAVDLVPVVGLELSRRDESQWWASVARDLLNRTGETDGLSAASLHLYLGDVARAAGDYEDAEREHVAAIAGLERVLGADHLQTAAARSNLAALYFNLARYDEAIAELRAALAVMVEAMGDHPHVAAAKLNLAAVYVSLARFDDAEREFLAAIEIQKHTLGEQHPDVATAYNNLGVLYDKQGKDDRAEANYLEALRIREATLDPEHAEMADSLTSLGVLHLQQKRYDRAERELLRALKINERARGKTHTAVARGHANLGVLYEKQGHHAKAETRLRTAIEIGEAAVGPEHPHVARARSSLGECLLAQGRFEEAHEELEQAVSIREKVLGRHPGLAKSLSALADVRLELGNHDTAAEAAEKALEIFVERGRDESEQARPRFALARARWELGEDRDAARVLAEEARRGYAKDPDSNAAGIEHIDAWLAEH